MPKWRVTLETSRTEHHFIVAPTAKEAQDFVEGEIEDSATVYDYDYDECSHGSDKTVSVIEIKEKK